MRNEILQCRLRCRGSVCFVCIAELFVRNEFMDGKIWVEKSKDSGKAAMLVAV